MEKRLKRAAVVVTILMMTGVAARSVEAQTGGKDREAREKAIIAAEHKVIDAVTKGDLSTFKGIVSTNGWTVDPSGQMAVKEFEKNFKQMKIEPGWQISDTRVIWVASNTAVLTYRWTGKATFMGQPLPPVVFATTVWHEEDKKRWVAMFHQETPAAPGK